MGKTGPPPSYNKHFESSQKLLKINIETLKDPSLEVFMILVHMGLVWTSCLAKFGLEFLFTFARFEPLGLLFQKLCCKLVWCTPVLETGFVYTYTVNWFCVHVYFKLV